MTTYADLTFDSDLSEWDTTAGDVRWFNVGGHEGGPSMFANGDLGTSRGSFDMGMIADTAFYRIRVNPALGFVGTPFYGLNAALGQTFALELVVGGVNLTVNTNAGTEVFALTVPYEIKGAFWVQFAITTGGSQGAVSAWINDNLAQPATTFGPNDAKKTRHIRAGILSGSANQRIYLDNITVADERIATPTWTPSLIDTWPAGNAGDGPRTHERWASVGAPTGGWQAFTDKTTGFTTLQASVVRNARDVVEFKDPSGNVHYSSPDGYGDVPFTDTIGRALYPQIAPLVRFHNVGQMVCVRTLIEFLTP